MNDDNAAFMWGATVGTCFALLVIAFVTGLLP